MWKKLLFLRKEALLSYLFFSLLFTCSIHKTQAATYYWRGGTGNWAQTDGPHWSSVPSATPLPGEYYSTQPTSNDDIIFDALSGLAGYTVSLNIGTSKPARNITVTAPVTWTGNLDFNLYGDMNLSSPITFSSYTGQIWVYQQTTGVTKNMNVGTTVFKSPIIFKPNFSGNTIITGTYTNTSYLEVDLAVNTDRVTFQTNLANVGGGLIIKRGEVYFEQGFTNYGGSSPDFIISPNGKLVTKNNSRTGTIYNAGVIDLNPLGSTLTHHFGTVTGTYYLYTPTAVSLNIQNCTVNIGNSWSYGSSINSIYTLQTNGSTLNFRPTATEFQPKNYTFSNVNVDSLGVPFRLLFESTNTGTTTPAFSNLNLMRDVDLQYSTANLGVLLRVNIDKFILWPGRSYFYKTYSGGFLNEPAGTYARFVCDSLFQMGTCERPIFLYKMAYELGAPGSVLSANIRSYDGIWALGGPYSTGAGSIMMSGGATGWTFPALPVPRTLIWVGPIPSPANIGNASTYGSWKNSANWRDAAELPVATGPGYTLGTPACPPTLMDSVVFHNNSYVQVADLSRSIARSINWLGTGRIFAANNVDMDIHGTLTFSPGMIHDFYGTYHFKNDRPYRCQIKTSNKPFRAGVVFNAASNSNSWLIVDSLTALTSDFDCGGAGNYSILIKSGHVHTGTVNCAAGNSAIISGRLHAFAGGLSLYDSDVIVTGAAGPNAVLKIEGVTLNAGTSNFICNSPTWQALDFGANKKYYAITISNTSTPISIGDPTHTVKFISGDTIASLKVNGNTKPWFEVTSTAAPVLIRKMELNTTYRSIFMNSIAPVIDSLVSVVPVEMALQNSDVKVRSYLGLAPGSHVYSYFPATPNKLILMAPTANYSNSVFSACFSGTSSYPGGGNANLNGSCTQQIMLENLIVDNLSSAVVNASYLNIVNSPITGLGGSYVNSNTSGNTSGWVGTASSPRKLRWKHSLAANNSSCNWNDPNNWEQLLPVALPAPQCPPTRLDTVLFDNTSFSGTTQKVVLSANQEVGSIYWRNINPGQLPELSGAGSLTLSVFASLEFHQNMVNNFNGMVKFRGQPTVSFPQNHITSNTIQFKNTVSLDGDAAATEWMLTDNMSLASGQLLFTQGRFLTNGKSINASYMELWTTASRYFNFANSTMYFSGAGYRVLNPSTVTIVSANSKIYASGSFTGGGKVYNDVTSSNSLNFEITNGDEFRNIHLTTGNTTISTLTSATGLKVKKILKECAALSFNVNYSLIDSMLLFGPVGSQSTILSSNKFFKDFEVKEGTTLTLGSGTVQWFQNQCDVDLIGTSTNTIQFYSTTPGVGNQAYLRKDSAVVCADFINMRDIWGVGNGNDPSSSCSSYSHPSNPNVNTVCASAHPYLISTCDTITDGFSACGPWEILLPLRGRAAFTAGDSADAQGNVAGWDFKPYPPVPSTVLASATPSICAGQSVTLTITGVGKLPFGLDYSDSDGNVYSHTITNASQLASYNPTTFAFTFTETVTPTSSITYYAGSIAIERCFNNTSPPGVGSVAITVNPYPQITNVVTATDVCSGNAVTIIPSTTVPATVNWASTGYPGVIGHGTSGAGTITETMTTSNATPTAVVYTLTPTANGCTGTPVDFTVNLNPRPNVVPGAAQNLDCNTSSVTISASSSTIGAQFGWTGPAIVSGASTSTPMVNGTGTYNVVVTNPATGCSSASSVNVSYLPDTQNPTITCPSNMAANASAGSCDASVNTPNPVISDNCGVTRLTWVLTGATTGSSPVSGVNYLGTHPFNTGVTSVTYTIQDAAGNTTTCFFTVTIVDNTLPALSCPADITTYTASNSCNRSVNTMNPVFSDNCGVTRLTWTTTGATILASPASGINYVGTQTFNVGTTTVTYAAFDAAGNTTSCSFTVSVSDTIAPTINCPAAMSAFTNAASCSASLVTPNPVVSDNCSIALQTWTISGATTGASPVSGIHNLGTFTFNAGVSIISYTVTDGSGNTSSCSYSVTITDPVTPTISCPGNLTSNTNAGVCTATVNNPNPVIGDNCSVTRLSYVISGATSASSPVSGINYVGSQVFNLGISTIIYTIADAAGNTSSCSYTVTVTDNQLPTVTCPANIAANTTGTTCDASVSIPTVTYGDNCTVNALTWTMTGATVAASPSSGINQVGTQTFNSGVTTITYTVRDASNNVSTCSFTVTITDVTPPVIPALSIVSGQCAATAPVPVASDHCSGFVNGTTSDPLTYNSQGTFVIHWTFTDAAGNAATANQTVIVDNSLPPTPPVLATLVGECSVTVPVPSATTGCSGAVLGTTSDPLIYNNQGTYTITWTFDDGMGNVVTTTQTVIVDDITDPLTPVVAPVSDECSVVLTPPTTTDNCSGIITGTTVNPTSYSTQGTFNVVWNFNDGNGNTSNVIQTVTIADLTAPTFSNCPSNMTVANDAGDCGALVSWIPPTANDNCAGYTVTSSHHPGDFFNLGITSVTYTVTDAGGNTQTCTFDVEVTDNEAPVINGCPSDISVPNDPSTCGAIVNWLLPIPSDNCPGVTITSTHDSGDLFATGTTTVTYTATDAAGNTSTCTFDVTVADTEAPIFAACPSDLTVNNDSGVCGAVVNWTPMTATDNCSGVTIVGSHNPGDLFPVGTTTVTYTATDDNGNSETCSFDITVTDAELPVLSGLNDLSVCEGGAANWNVTATDNCTIQSLTSNYMSGTVLPLGNTWVVYTAVDASGNAAVDSFMVNVFASASVNIELQPTADLCVGNPVTLNVLNPVAGATYSWEFNGAVIGTGTQLILSEIQIAQNGIYNVVSDLPGGCLSYGSINVAADFCDLIIPEAVTPNADGNNDTWYIENLENYPNSTVQIVNRWGAVVFESDDYKNDWDGTSQNKMNVGGDELPEGTFYYVLQIGGDSGSKFYHKVFTGYIYLKRK